MTREEILIMERRMCGTLEKIYLRRDMQFSQGDETSNQSVRSDEMNRCICKMQLSCPSHTNTHTQRFVFCDSTSVSGHLYFFF